MNRRVLYALALLLASASVATAQIIRPPSGQRPTAWTSLSIGWVQQQDFCDRDTDDCLEFGGAPQWRGSLEMPVGFGGTSVGVVGTIAKVPLIYRGTGLAPNSCANCDADASVAQVLGVLRMGGGTGFHQVIDASAGMTMFSNFRATNDGTKLGTGKTSQNFTFAIAYGFGYGLSPRTQIFLTQEYGLLILPRQPGSVNNTANQFTLRVGGRYGLGGK